VKELELYKQLSLELEVYNKEEIEMLRLELSERDNECTGYEYYFDEVQSIIKEKDQAIDVLKSKIAQLASQMDRISQEMLGEENKASLLKMKSNDLLNNYSTLLEKVKNARSWSIQRDSMILEKENLSKQLDSVTVCI